MEHTRFVGLDIHKERISIAMTESGRSGAVEYLGEIANDPDAISKLCDRPGRSGKPLVFFMRPDRRLWCSSPTNQPWPSLGRPNEAAHRPSAIMRVH